MAKQTNDDFERIEFKMHPRVFAALGADLVTNDVVAIIELVKNSYDAFASNVWVRFRSDPKDGDYIEIEDDGQGMSKETIENVWCLVATPHRQEHPMATSGDKRRRVAGEKGLGRLSVARLGDRLEMLTQSRGAPCLEVQVNWGHVARQGKMSSCFANCREHPGKVPFTRSGTRIRICSLKVKWTEPRLADLKENLARLVSPFARVEDFSIFLSGPGHSETDEMKITTPEFLGKPKYLIKGLVDDKGNVSGSYRFAPIGEGKPRVQKVQLAWTQVYESIQDRSMAPFDEKQAHCGSFSFEIRSWDIGPDDTQEIAERFAFQKSRVRKEIGAHKGISVYRDNILVLPKSDAARDWLGLDRRRISDVGKRLSTNQLVGYVAISADANPDIEDTSDRERLAQNLAVTEFEEILIAIVRVLENERSADRTPTERKQPLQDLFLQLSAEKLMEDVADLAEQGETASAAVVLVQEYSARLKEIREDIQTRFTYYSRLATVGTIAQMLVHEIRNRTTAVGCFLDLVRTRYAPFKDKAVDEECRAADDALQTLERLADTFAPLASRSFRRRQRHSILEDRIRSCLALQKGELRRKQIDCTVPKGETQVEVDPGELDAILLNLITNACYWLGQTEEGKRAIAFRTIRAHEGRRILVWADDSGAGVKDEVKEKIFLPGFTKKPAGIGMGLTVASELVAEYGGQMILQSPGPRGGASFGFDLPVKQ